MRKNVLKIFTISLILCACADKTPSFGVHSELQSNYLNDDYTNYSAYVNGQSENSRPEAMKISLDGVEIGSKIVTYENDTVVDTYNYDKALDSNNYDLYNLKIATNYKTEIFKDDQVVKTIEFKLDDIAPRNLYVDGVTNCRDLGGWKIDKKHRVKQGLIYRTAKYNDDESTDLLVTEAGINTLKNTLGIKTEIDLRKTSDNENGGITTSPLGEEVKYISYPMVSSGNVMTLNKTRLKDLFDYFADNSNYPIAFHCSIGTDRTGLVAFLLNGLLGVSKDDLYRDYLFSNFGLIYNMRTAKTIDEYLETVEMSTGNELKDKFYNYLSSNGVSTLSLDKIRENLIENY